MAARVWWQLARACWPPLKEELFRSFSKCFEASSAHTSSLALGDEESVRFFPLQKPSRLSITVLFGHRCGGTQGTTRRGPDLEEDPAKLLQDEPWRTLVLPVTSLAFLPHPAQPGGGGWLGS